MPTEPADVNMIELSDVIGKLVAGQRKLQEVCSQLIAKNAEQDEKIAEQDRQAAVQQRLIDSHELRIEMVERVFPAGNFDA
jgi:hypothetical protein